MSMFMHITSLKIFQISLKFLWYLQSTYFFDYFHVSTVQLGGFKRFMKGKRNRSSAEAVQKIFKKGLSIIHRR